jgi:hypothetical protein
MSTSIYPLSYNQRLIWTMQHMALESPVYCEAIVCRILSDLDVQALQRTCQWLSDRHSSLRTNYGIHKGNPAQFVHEQQRVPFHIRDASDWGEEDLQAEFARELRRMPNLESGPMVRGSLFLRQPGQHLLLLAFHHIAIDLYSMVLVFQDFLRLYPIARQGSPCPPPSATQYCDFIKWQNDFVVSDEANRQLQFWQEQSARNAAPLDLPVDYDYPEKLSYEGDTFRFTLNADLTSRLRSLASGSGATLNAVLLGGFQTILHQWCGKERFNIRTIVLGRSDPAFSSVVGFFSNIVPIYADFADDPSFTEVVLRARDSVVAAFENQDYPMLLLPSRLQPPGYAALSSNVLFRMQIPQRFRSELREQKLADEFGLPASTKGVRMNFGDLIVEVLVPEKKTSMSSIDFELVEAGGEIACFIHYKTRLFKRETIARLGDGYARLLTSAAAEPAARVAKLDGMAAARDGREITTPDHCGSGQWKCHVTPALGMPQTPTERWLARVWSDLFAPACPSRHDNFFFQGGDSLMAVYLSSMISLEFGIETPGAALLESPTLAELAAYIDKEKER